MNYYAAQHIGHDKYCLDLDNGNRVAGAIEN